VWGSVLGTKAFVSGCLPLIILLQQEAGPADRARVGSALRSLGLTVEETRLGPRYAYLVRAAGGSRPAESLARIPSVDRVIPLDPRAPRVEATARDGARTVAVGEARFGGGHVGVVAGPCTVESEDALERTARRVAAAGACALRGGVFKVRTSPYGYQGGGMEALASLREVSRRVGLPFFTELSDPRQVADVADFVDGVQIGARHMQNYPLLLEAAALGKPVLLKRHMAAEVDEWLLAAEYVLDGGNDQVILCERGVKTADRHVRYMLDVGVVPYLKQRVGLPVIVDPSHAAGNHRLVPALARAAIAAGADGLIVEVHPEPETTQCDALQALLPDDFADLMRDVDALVALGGRTLAGGVPRPSIRAERASA